MMIFQKFVKNGEMLKNVGENIKKTFIALILFYTQDIKNIIFNQSLPTFFAISTYKLIKYTYI